MTEKLPLVLEGAFVTGPPPQLIGSSCSECGRKFFPRRSVCPVCFKEVAPVHLSTAGTVYTYTVVRTKPPFGLPQPYSVGLVDLDEEHLRIFTLFDPEYGDKIRIGQRVRLGTSEVGCDREGKPCIRYFFTPCDVEEKQ